VSEQPYDREHLGQQVRLIWIAWAEEQPNPKASWLRPWHGLSEPEREVDRRIGERLYAQGVAERDRLVRDVAEWRETAETYFADNQRLRAMLGAAQRESAGHKKAAAELAADLAALVVRVERVRAMCEALAPGDICYRSARNVLDALREARPSTSDDDGLARIVAAGQRIMSLAGQAAAEMATTEDGARGSVRHHIAQARAEERERIAALWEAVGLRGAAAVGSRQSLVGLDGTSVEVDRHAMNAFWTTVDGAPC